MNKLQQTSEIAYKQGAKDSNEETIRIIRKHLADWARQYSHDEEAHKQGKCSYPVIAVCSAEEHKWKDSIAKMADRIRAEIERDIHQSNFQKFNRK